MSVQTLCSDNRGSVAIEFSLICLVLVMIMFYFADLVKMQAQIGKMERAVYSISGILRERTQFYKVETNSEDQNYEIVKQPDVNQLLALAKQMLTNMKFSDELVAGVSLRVEQIHFEPWTFDDKSLVWDKPKNIVPEKSEPVMAGSAGDDCKARINLREDPAVLDMVPKSSFNRWIPLYQVVLCMPPVELFNPLLRTSDRNNVSYSIVMVR
jgi:tight adherence protein F